MLGDLKQSAQIEYEYGICLAWAKFHQFRSSFTDAHVSLKLKMKLFDCTVSPAILFGLAAVPLTCIHLKKLDAIQRRMLRSIVGWVQFQDESWRDTMVNMKSTVNFFC